MSYLIIASAASLATGPATLVSLVGCLLLLSLRAWSSVKGVLPTQSVFRLLDASVLVLGVLFLILVVIRFRKLA